jgi:hypothetical protein
MKPTARNLIASLLRTAAVLLSVASAPGLHAAGSKNPVGKLYVAILGGAADLVGSNKITDLKKKTAHTVNDTVLETKRSAGQENAASDQPDYSAMVFSNGTGMYVDPDTRLQVKKFEQQPFTPNRTDMDVEPSISNTETLLERGTVGLCTPKMALGSTMQYRTPLGAVNIRARRVVIEAFEDYTRVAVIEGESTVQAGDGSAVDLGGQVLKAGQQAYIRKGPAGQPPIVQIENISERMMAQLDDKVAMACVAKKSVYFEAVDRTVGTGADGTDNLVAGASGDDKSGENNTSGVSAFDDAPTQEIVVIEVVPVNLPVEYTVSPARVVK